MIVPMWATPIGYYRIEADYDALDAAFPAVAGDGVNINRTMFDTEPFASLRPKFQECADDFSRQVAIGQMGFSYAYVNRHEYGMTNTPHHHAHCRAFGVYYIRAGKDMGDILLHDPRGAINWPANPMEFSNRGTYTSSRSFVRHTPKPGDFLICPAFVIHSVEANQTEHDRVSLAIDLYDKEFIRKVREGTE